MSADTSDLTKVDSAVGGVEGDAKAAAKKERKSSSYPGVMNVSQLQEEGTKLEIAKETQRLGWKLNTSPTSVEDPAMLKVALTKPPVKKIDLRMPTGIELTCRNLKGCTIKDALDAIYKAYKKKQDDELGEMPYLKGFEWDPEESWTSLKIHLDRTGLPPVGGSKKKKAAKNEDAE